MKKITKALSVMLAVMMIMCTVSALSFSASAAETSAQTATIYFAAPRGTGIANSWRNAQLYYGSTTTVGKLARIDMQRTGKVYAGDKGSLKTIVSDDWDVYSVTLNATQIAAIDSAKYVGFINANNRKTGLKKPIVKVTASGTYATTKSSIAAYNGKMFVINGSYLDSEISSYTVKTVDYNVSDEHTVNVTSNVASASSCKYSSSDSQVTVTYTLDSDMSVENIQAVVNYDKSVLELASTNTKRNISPVFYGVNGAGYEANLALDSRIKFNATSLDGYDFAGGKTVFTAVFDIVGSGDTTVDFDVYMLTGTENNKDIKMVYKDEVMSDNFTVTAKASV